MDEKLKENKVAQEILDVAQDLLQEKGYHAFSYRDLSQQVGIKTSSIHYYFPTKEDLAKALTVRYRDHFKVALSQIDTQTDNPKTKLELYLKLFLESFRSSKRVCLCSMLATDFANLPEPVQAEIKSLFADNERWLTEVLEAGREQGVLQFEGAAELKAKAIFAALEGATISARTFEDEGRITCVTGWLKSMLE